jgi:hypothetical protein
VKPLLVGEANPYGADPYFALYPLPEQASGGRLARILGLSESQYLRFFDRRNLCPTKWSAPVARAQAEAIRESIRLGERTAVVLLGAKVSRAFGLDYAPFTASRHLYVLPHPSGLNRIWNEAGSVERARELLAPVLREVA